MYPHLRNTDQVHYVVLLVVMVTRKIVTHLVGYRPNCTAILFLSGFNGSQLKKEGKPSALLGIERSALNKDWGENVSSKVQ